MGKRGGLLGRPACLFLFVLLSCLYSYRIFTGGALVISGDAYAQNYPMRAFYASLLKGMELPLWNPYEGAGMPLVGELHVGVLYPVNIALYSLLPVPYAFNVNFILQFALAGFFTFLYLREAGLRQMPSLAGGVVFAFLGFFAGHKAHTSMLDASLWLPAIVFLLERLRKTLDVRYALGIALAAGVQIFAGHTQMCLYTYMAAALFVLFHLTGEGGGRRARFAGLSALGLALGVVLALPQLVSTMRLDTFSWRSGTMETMGYLFFKEFHVYLRDLPSLVFPHLFYGGYGAAVPKAADDSVVAFVGVLPLALAAVVAAREFRAERFVRLWATVAALGLVLSLGDDTPLGRALFHLPVYGLFRSHSRNLLEFTFAVAALFAWGLDRALSSGRHLRAAIGVVFGVLAASAAALAALNFVAGPGLKEAVGFGNPAVYVPLALTGLYLLGLLACLKFPSAKASYALFAVLLLEAFSFGGFVDRGVTGIKDMGSICRKEGYDNYAAMSAGRDFRLFRTPTKHSELHNVPCGVGMFNSYSAFIFKDYADLFDLDPHGYSRYWDHLLVNNSLLSMMNVRFIEVPKPSHVNARGLVAAERDVKPEVVYHSADKLALSAGEAKAGNLYSTTVRLAPGTYLVSVLAKALEKNASLRLEVFSENQERLRFRLTPLQIYPGVIAGEYREYYRVYHADETKDVAITLISVKFQPIEIAEVRVARLAGYGPLPMAAPGRAYRTVYETADMAVLENLNALPRAFSVSEVLPARDFTEVKRRLDLNEINPARQALLYEEDIEALGGREFSAGSARVEDYGANAVSLSTDFEGRGFVVLSEQHYPGWRAYVDGRETRIYKVNGILRGIAVPPGRHKVVFKYMPHDELALMVLSAFSATAMVLFIAFSGGRRREVQNPASPPGRS